MPRQRMYVISAPPPGTATIAPPDDSRPAVKGEGDGAGPMSYLCGACDFVIIETVQLGLFHGPMVFQCGRCRAFNLIGRPDGDEPKGPPNVDRPN